MKACFIILSLMLGYSLSAQTIKVQGNITSEEKNELVNFVHVESKNYNIGTASDAKGHFKLVYPDSIEIDTLTFSAIGFENLEMPIILSKIDLNLNVVLKETSYLLDSISIVPNTGNFVIGHNYFGTSTLLEVAVKIENPDSSKNCNLIEAIYHIHKRGKHKAPFRVRVRQIDSITGAPGKDLLNWSIISKAKKKNKWHSVDLSIDPIEIPSEGLFLCMEWLNNGDQYIYEQDLGKFGKKQMLGQYLSIRGTKGKQGSTWGRREGADWGNYKRFNALIKAGVKCE